MLLSLMNRLVLTTVSLCVLALAACSGDMHRNDDLSSGNQKLQAGISEARTGIQQVQAGNADTGLKAVAGGRDMMGQAVVMMGGGCCLVDGGTVDGGVMESCAAMMGDGMNMMLKGLAKFDGGRGMMMSSDAAAADQAMADMGTGMQMMEQGAAQMMGGNKGSMSGMHSR